MSQNVGLHLFYKPVQDLPEHFKHFLLCFNIAAMNVTFSISIFYAPIGQF